MYVFFLENKQKFSKRQFKQWACTIYNFKLYQNSDLYKSLEAGFVEKFLQLFPEMDMIDLVPVCRNLVRGPTFKNETI
jgi:hypothetical protein